MGEYAQFQGEQVKIGTCEDMYYLRADQAPLVRALSGNVDPVRDAPSIRFRFPFPDEDRIAPGAFENYDRSLAVPVAMPEGVDHSSVQFKADAGYLVSLPCPEGQARSEGAVDTGLTITTGSGLRIGRNGFSGAVHVVQQKWVGEGAERRLVLICKCGGCGSRWRVEDWADAEVIVVALHSRADRDGGQFFHIIANRITDGYLSPERVFEWRTSNGVR